MKNKTKALLIPIAAFAVTVTGASAFSLDALDKADIPEEQRSAFEQAHELRKEGDTKAAREVLMNADIDIQTIHEVHDAMKEHRAQMHEEVEQALKDGDYEAFLKAVQDSPMAETIDTPAEFDLFMQAYTLRESGDKAGAREMMEDLGFEGKMMKEKGHGMHKENGDMHGMRGMMNGYDEEHSEGNDEGDHGMMR